MKKNSFRCFAIFKSGVGDDIGSFLLVHKRGCKKTFANTETKLRTMLTERNYESNKQFNVKNFNFDNWYAIRDEINGKEGVWFAMLCHKGCNPDKVYTALDRLQAYYLKIKDYYTLSFDNLKQKYNVETIVLEAEEKIYGNSNDGYMTEEEIIEQSGPPKPQQIIKQQFQTPEKKQKAEADQKKVGQQVQNFSLNWNQAISNSDKKVINNPILQSGAIQIGKLPDNPQSTALRQDNLKRSVIKKDESQIKEKRQKHQFESQDATSEMRNISNQKTSDGYILSLILLTFLGAVITGAYIFLAEP